MGDQGEGLIIRMDQGCVVKVSTKNGKLLLADIRKITGREDCIGIAYKDKEECWVLCNFSEEGDLLPHAGGWHEAGEYSTWPLLGNIPKICVKREKDDDDDDITLAALVTKEEAIAMKLKKGEEENKDRDRSRREEDRQSRKTNKEKIWSIEKKSRSRDRKRSRSRSRDRKRSRSRSPDKKSMRTEKNRSREDKRAGADIKASGLRIA